MEGAKASLGQVSCLSLCHNNSSTNTGLKFLLVSIVCACEHACGRTHVELFVWFHHVNSGCQCWWQVPLPSGPSQHLLEAGRLSTEVVDVLPRSWGLSWVSPTGQSRPLADSHLPHAKLSTFTNLVDAPHIPLISQRWGEHSVGVTEQCGWNVRCLLRALLPVACSFSTVLAVQFLESVVSHTCPT